MWAKNHFVRELKVPRKAVALSVQERDIARGPVARNLGGLWPCGGGECPDGPSDSRQLAQARHRTWPLADR
jgi:hypothetical protein